jgi:nitrile hydratase accessory protein
MTELDTAAKRAAIPEMDGTLAYPRRNGEPVFEAPWQSRAFGMVVSLHTAGKYSWNDFKERLIGAISTGHAPDAPNDASDYYYHWVAAASSLLVEKGILSESELNDRMEDFLSGRRRDVY